MDFQHDYHAGMFMQKMEELREWQRQQQDKLLQQQEEQRLLLTNEHQRMYEVFGLQNIDAFHTQSSRFVLPEGSNRLHSPNENSPDDAQDSTAEENGSFNRNDLPSNLYAREMEIRISNSSPTLQSVVNDNARETHTLDETPVVCRNKDFHQLLQEKLEQYGGNDTTTATTTTNNNEDKQHKPKRRFLRKGEGLARFRMKPAVLQSQEKGSGKGNIKRTSTNLPNSNITKLDNPGDRSKKSAFSLATGTNRSNVKKGLSTNFIKSDKNCTGGSTKTLTSKYPKSAMPKLILKNRETSQSVSTWADFLQQQNLPGQKLQLCSHNPEVKRTDLPQNGSANDSIEVSFLEKLKDADKRSKKEVEELKVFELLEQHAANSSFCSTSSLVAQLMEGSINSTPIKNHSFMTMHNYATENLATSVLHSFSPKGHKDQEQMLSGCLQFHNKNTSSGYLPYGLDNSDTESSTNKDLESDNHRFGVHDKSRNPASESAITDCEQTSLNTSNNSTRINSGANSPCSKHLHVRFAETNEYKSISDGDTSISSHSDTSRNINYSHKCDGQHVESTNAARSKNSKFFEDDQAWSDDDCSCTSSEDGKSLSSVYQSLTVRASPKISTQHHIVTHEYQVHNMKSDIDRCPAGLDKSHHLLNTSANTDTHADDQNQTDTRGITHAKSDGEIVFKSALLQTRLEQLEKEIEIFRQENTTLQKKQKRHAEEVLKFNKEKNELKKKMQEQEKMESFLQEERKKLNKEKSVFEKYCKDLRNQPTKQERGEIQALKQQLTEIQEEMHKKDSRWSAAQVRTRDRLKQLEQENAQLKNEVEKLKKENHQTKLVKSNTIRRRHGVSTTNILQAINDHIAKIKPSDLEDSIIVHDVVPRKKIPASVLQQQNNLQHKQAKAKQCNDTKINEWGDMSSKSYQTYLSIPDLNPAPSTDLLRVKEDRTSQNIVTNHRVCNNSSQNSKVTVERGHTNHHTYSDNASCSCEEHDVEGNNRVSTDVPSDRNKIHMAIYDAFYHANPVITGKAYPENRPDTNSGKATQIQDNRHEVNTTSGVSEIICKSHDFSRTDSEKGNVSTAPTAPDSDTSSCHSDTPPTENCSTVSKQSPNREKVYSDGRKEIWYPNGNLKKISADQSVTKMIYYNGDVKETLSDGTLKYFYAETKTWHTTYADGSEILEFPDGQIEHHQKDGTKEITYPNATVRTCFPDGKEEWVFQDGLVVKVDSQLGEKVLLLPNGQREVHTKEHMRREYPDGTMKTIYPDGIQETRYANGRIRVKDKLGNLIMDSVMQRL